MAYKTIDLGEKVADCYQATLQEGFQGGEIALVSRIRSSLRDRLLSKISNCYRKLALAEASIYNYLSKVFGTQPLITKDSYLEIMAAQTTDPLTALRIGLR